MTAYWRVLMGQLKDSTAKSLSFPGLATFPLLAPTYSLSSAAFAAPRLSGKQHVLPMAIDPARMQVNRAVLLRFGR